MTPHDKLLALGWEFEDTYNNGIIFCKADETNVLININFYYKNVSVYKIPEEDNIIIPQPIDLPLAKILIEYLEELE